MGTQPVEGSSLTTDVIESLDLPPNPTLGHLVAAVERKYGKPLVFEESSPEILGEGVTGQWIDLPGHGIVRYLPGIKTWSRHVVLHELSHILLDHKGKPFDGLVSAGFFLGIGKRRGVSWMCRAVDVPLDEAEEAAENLAFGLAQILHTAPVKTVSKAERVFGL
jgi:hypothetical protein